MEDGTEPEPELALLDVLRRYKAGEVSWTEALDFAANGWVRRPHRGVTDLAWHGYEDSVPQPGTLQEVLFAELDPAEEDDLLAVLSAADDDA